MTNPIPRKISELPLLSSLSNNDFFPVVDVSDTALNSSGETKKVNYITLKTNIQNSINTSFTETDPVFSASVAFDITQTNVDQWDAAYAWGNHAVQGYLQSLSAQSINNLVDVDTTGVAADNVLKWSGSAWIAGEVTSGTTINVLNDVGNVNITSVANNQVLKYNSTTSKWENSSQSGGISLSDLSVTSNSPSTSPSLSYNNTSGQFTYTPPDFSAVLQNVVDDTTPQLGGDLDLNNNNIDGTGDVNITGEVKASSFRIKTNNATIAGTSGNNRDIKVIGGAPYYYDGTEWRQFYLIDAPTTIPSDTDWDNVMIRSTFDSNIVDVKYNVTPEKIYSTNSTSDAIDIVTSPIKVGAGCLRINGDAEAYSRLRYPMTSNYSFTGAWTMEAWVNFDSSSMSTNNQSIFNGDGANGEFALFAKENNDGLILFSWYNSENPSHRGSSGTLMGSIAENAIVGAWCHVALVRDSSDARIRLYLNGNSDNNTIITDNDIVNPDNFNIGGFRGQNNYFSFDGFIDDVRISRSTRYTANFTNSLPTTQLPISGTTSQISIPPRYVQGEIALGSSPTWTGTPGVTPSRLSAGRYRLTFATSYSTDEDYIVLAQGMDQGFGCYIEVNRYTDNVIFHIKRADTNGNIDDGFIAIQVINK